MRASAKSLYVNQKLSPNLYAARSHPILYFSDYSKAMDLFSLVFGVAGLVGLAQVVVEKGFSYISTANSSREDIRNLISEVAI